MANNATVVDHDTVETDEGRKHDGLARQIEALGVSASSRRPGTSKSGGSSCANIPATCWTAGRCRPIEFLQEGQLTTR
jgi:hypothetical protein